MNRPAPPGVTPMGAFAASVILPTRRPHAGRLARALSALRTQTLPLPEWELVIVDNSGAGPGTLAGLDLSWHPHARIVAEARVGLTPARLRGFAESGGEVLVFVDDDNVLAAGYLGAAVRRFAADPWLGCAGGPVRPEFEAPPPEWTREFWSLLALHEHGEAPLVAAGGAAAPWPEHAPVGAGLCVRRTAADRYLAAAAEAPERRRLDRAGSSLSSGGDSDCVFTVLRAGWNVGYFPELCVTHLIPPSRLEPRYLGRLNEGIQRTWVRVLALHGCCPWPAISRWSLPLRGARAWWRERAWRSAAHRIRWRGRMGRLAGQADRSSGGRLP